MISFPAISTSIGDLDVDLVPMEDWAAKEGEMARIFTGFLARAQAKAA
jgi:hypothetical protein